MELDKIKGMIPPVVTPFKDNEELDEVATRKEIKFLLDKNVDGIAVAGSTGEGVILSNDEIKRILNIVNEENEKNIPVITGIIRNSTREAIQTSLLAKNMGVDALLITPTFYYGNSLAGNYEYYSKIAEETNLPIIVYNVVPTNQITPEEMVKLSNIEQVIGIKQVEVNGLVKMLSVSENKFKVFSACDNMLYSTYVIGASGAIAAIITVAPDLCIKQWQAYKAGDYKTAQSIHYKLFHIYEAYKEKPFPGKIKEMLNQNGRPVGRARSPILEPDRLEKEFIKNKLVRAGLL